MQPQNWPVWELPVLWKARGMWRQRDEFSLDTEQIDLRSSPWPSAAAPPPQTPVVWGEGQLVKHSSWRPQAEQRALVSDGFCAELQGLRSPLPCPVWGAPVTRHSHLSSPLLPSTPKQESAGTCLKITCLYREELGVGGCGLSVKKLPTHPTVPQSEAHQTTSPGYLINILVPYFKT